MESLHIKNTFIEVSEESHESDSSSSLPRAVSDQSHARRSVLSPSVPFARFISIPENYPDGECEDSIEGQRIDSQELRTLRTISRPQFMAGMVFPAEPPSTLHFSVPPLEIREALPRCSVPVGDFVWHEESSKMGELSSDAKSFTKIEFDGRLSMVTESSVHRSGTQRYVMQVEAGPVSVADGIGFVFSPTLPCKKNIQKIDSIFLNRKGKICSRVKNELEMLNTSTIGSIEVGTLVELIVDLDSLIAIFSIYSPPQGIDHETMGLLVRDESTFSTWLTGTAAVSIESVLAKSESKPVGHFCAVVKNSRTKIRFL